MADGIIKVLPEDVMMFILIRLNVKSLIRLKCVFKTLYTLLQSSMFINFHLKRTTTAKDEFILLKRSFQERPNKFKDLCYLKAESRGIWSTDSHTFRSRCCREERLLGHGQC
uniref:F-box domain-containing protein n=1 Tax=Nicotiana tabacum TaxID=4097 RepID=A0A1S4BL30_TOBAC|nr:PREDICTED: uncharacterized protein LOC107809462 [Nicotiana tabacum]